MCNDMNRTDGWLEDVNFWTLNFLTRVTLFTRMLFFQSCSLRRGGGMQSCSIFMETWATAYRVRFLISCISWSSLSDLQYADAHSFIPVRSWSGGHIKWGQSFRIRHITTGRYLCLDEEKGLLLVDSEKANSKMSAFCFRISKVIVMQIQLCHNCVREVIVRYRDSWYSQCFHWNHRRKLKWPRSEMLKAWARLRSSMESPCASFSMFHLASGLHMLLLMPNLPVWVL